ncbi:MAG: ACGX-repeat peptide [Syntrophomonadaceae bacterium]|jgi:ACGX-repeat protein|nr:ACGX-repeat peptide [Syntrophomonadaceae bacterium]
MSKLNLHGEWTDKTRGFFAPKSAQGYQYSATEAAGSCGSSCGAGDDTSKEEPKPSACGSACGASDDK